MKGALLIGLFAIWVGACGGAAVPASGAPVRSATPSAALATPSVAPTVEPAPPAANYPYMLDWPAEEIEKPWRYASVAWDGTSRIDHGNKYTDQATTTFGDLFAYGIPTTISVAEFESRVASQAAELHNCEPEPTDREALRAGGSEGIYAVYHCGSIPVLRWVGIHDGFGLFIGLILKPFVDVEDASARFKERVSALTWVPRATPMP